jgi:hypothetical protein
MEDIYAALMGEPISEEEKMRALARKMAVQRSMGQTGQILGGRLLDKPSSQMINTADESAGKLAGFAARKRELTAQEAMARMNDEARARENALDRADNDKERALRLALERMQQSGANSRAAMDGGKGYRELPANLINKLADEASASRTTSDTVSSFKPEYARVGANAPPGLRRLKNYAASLGYGSEEDKAAQDWWANWDRNYTIETRNKMFGSALTKKETEAWDAANITRDMTPDQITKALNNLEEKRIEALDKKKKTYRVAGIDPLLLDEIYGGGEGPAVPKQGGKKTADDYDTFAEYKAAVEAGEAE